MTIRELQKQLKKQIEEEKTLLIKARERRDYLYVLLKDDDSAEVRDLYIRACHLCVIIFERKRIYSETLALISI